MRPLYAPIGPSASRRPLGPPASRRPLGTPASRRPNLQWHSRDDLPHFDHPGLIQAITFRLADSLLQSVLDQVEIELKTVPATDRQTQREKRLTDWLDQGCGECLLRQPS